MRLNVATLGIAFFVCLAGCSHPSDPPVNTVIPDPTVLVDTNEREVRSDCSGKIVSDKIVRIAAVNIIKMNPKRNIPIDSSSFFNLDMANAEFTPRIDMFKGPGGDNYKFVAFCQLPKVDGCDMAVKAGDNRIEYKFWSYKTAPCQESPRANCQSDVLEEHDVRMIHFTTKTEISNRICKRKPTNCTTTGAAPEWSECVY